MPAPDNQFKLVFGFAASGHFLFHLLVALYLTIVLVLEVEWQRSYDELISLWTLGALLLGLAAPLAGWLSDHWGAGKIMVIYFLGIGLATAVCGLAAGPESLTIFLGLVGFFGAIYHPVGTAWLVANARAKGKAIGALGIFGGMGTAAAALIAGSLIDLASWRLAFIVPGLVAVAAGLCLWRLLAKGLIVERKQDLQPEPEPSRADLRRAFAALVVTMSVTTIIYYAFTTMLPKWLDVELGAMLGDGLLGLGALITGVYLLGAVSQLIGGHLSDKGSAKSAYIASYALKIAALGAAYAITGWPVLIAAVLVVFAFDIAAPVENVLIARFSPSHRRGLAYGIRNGIAIVAAPLGVQLVARFYTPGSGFQDLFLILGGLALMSLLAALFLPSDRPRKAVQSEA
jgi:FSR family fosmidomycin resistance protein-like MFS transporter